MKKLLLPVLFAFVALTVQAQLSADNYNLKAQDIAAFELSTGTAQLDADAQGDDFYKKRRKSKSKSSPLGYGLIVGGSMFNVSGDGMDDAEMKFGAQFGLVATYQLTDIFGVKSGLVYTQKGYKYEMDIFGVKFSSTQSFNYLNIPILGTVGFGDNIRFYANAGPVVGILMSAKSKADGDSEDIKENMKSTDIAALVGGGTIIPIIKSRGSSTISLLADVNYQLGLTNVSDSNDISVKNSGLTFGIGVLIGGI